MAAPDEIAVFAAKCLNAVPHSSGWQGRELKYIEPAGLR
jgi:hypothetical protein